MLKASLGRAAVIFVSAAALAGVASAADGPARKGGLWAMDVGAMGMTMKTEVCADPAADTSMFTQRNPAAECAPATVTRQGNGYAFRVTCAMSGGMTSETSGTATGDFQSAYTVNSTTRMSGANMPSMPAMNTTMNARYVGACPADLNPGDVRMGKRIIRAKK